MSADGRSPTTREPSDRTATPPAPTAPVPAPDRRAYGRSGPDGDSRSIPDLLRHLSTEAGDLVRQEVALAKAEMHEKLDVYQRNLVSIAVGGAFLLAALLFAVWALNTGVTALLAQFMALEIAVWLSPLLLGIALAAIGWGMIGKGKRAIQREGVTPRKTKATLQEDKRWAQTKAKQVKEEVQHG